MSESSPSSQHGQRHPTLAARPSHPTRPKPQSTTASHANVNSVLTHSAHIHPTHHDVSETPRNVPCHAPTPVRIPSSSAVCTQTEHAITHRHEKYFAAFNKCNVDESRPELDTWPLGLALARAACLACATHCHRRIQNGNATATGFANIAFALPKPWHCSPCFPIVPSLPVDHDDVTNRHAVNSPCHSINPAEVRASATRTCARSTGDRSCHHGELCVITLSATDAASSSGVSSNAPLASSSTESASKRSPSVVVASSGARRRSRISRTLLWRDIPGV